MAHQGWLESSSNGENTATVAGPAIVLHPAEQPAGALRSVQEQDVQLKLTKSRSSDDDSPRESIDLEDAVAAFRSVTNGLVTPTSITCSLNLTFGDSPVPDVPEDFELSLTDPNSYSGLEKISQTHLRATVQDAFTAKELTLRYGNCTIIGQHIGNSFLPLTSSEDWNDICTILTNYWTSRPHQHYRLEILRDYFAFQHKATSDVSFAGAKRTEIHTLMKQASDGRLYISRTDLMQITSKDTIRDIINQDPQLDIPPEEKQAFIWQVQTRAQKLLAMCVLAGLSMGCLKTLLDNGCSDTTQPLKRHHCCHIKCNADFENLVSRQGGFCAAEFWTMGEHQKFHPSVVVPIHLIPRDKNGDEALDAIMTTRSDETEEDVGDEEPAKREAWCGSGAYSNVYRVKINPSHHRLADDKNADFALKEFKDRPKRVVGDFGQELRILDELRKLSQRHIVTHLATWTQGGRYCMLFPYAQCNLRQYMTYEVFGPASRDNILWLLKQFRGLAEALKDIHNLSGAIANPSASSLTPQPIETRRAGWHHDIKPENMLYFLSARSTQGTFKVADFGSGKVHTYRSGSVNTHSPNGTLTYEPPEAKAEGATSRPYDVWSLGCVFLEILIWAVRDFRSVKTFTSQRTARRSPDSRTDILVDDGFWQMAEDGTATLRQSVLDCIQSLRGLVSQQEGEPFKEVLELVVCMLDVDRRSRVIALDVWNTLDSIYKQKRLDLNKMMVGDSKLEREDPTNPLVVLPRLSMNPPGRRSPEPTQATLSTSGRRVILADREFLTASPIDTLSTRNNFHPHRRNSSASMISSASRNPSISSTGGDHGSIDGRVEEDV